MSNDIEYFPRGSTTTTTTKTDSSSTEKPRKNRVDRDDLFLGTSSKRKRSQQIKTDQKKKKKKSLDGEDHQDALYRRLHKQVRSSISTFSFKKQTFFIRRILPMVFSSLVASKKSHRMNYVLVFHIKISVIFH
jgi:hypothetical protein